MTFRWHLSLRRRNKISKVRKWNKNICSEEQFLDFRHSRSSPETRQERLQANNRCFSSEHRFAWTRKRLNIDGETVINRFRFYFCYANTVFCSVTTSASWRLIVPDSRTFCLQAKQGPRKKPIWIKIRRNDKVVMGDLYGWAVFRRL